jgi:hypothetical protein
MAAKIYFYLYIFFKIFVLYLNTNCSRDMQSLDPDLVIPNPRPSSLQAPIDRFLNDKKPSTSAAIYTDKKEKKIFLIYKDIQKGSVAKSYMRKCFLIYEEVRKYLTICEEVVSHK